MTDQPTPDARAIRREQLRNLADRQFPTAAERNAAAALLAVEFEDGDQARGRAAVSAAEVTEAWDRVRRLEKRHERLAERLRAARQGEAEAVRARQAAEADAHIQARAAAATEAEWRGALARAEKAEAAITRVRELLPTEPRPEYGLPNDLAYSSGLHDAYAAVREALDGSEPDAPAPVKRNVTCGEPGWAEQERARMERLYTDAYSRAEQAEAAITRVRALARQAIADWADIDGGTVLDALDGTGDTPADPCAHGCRDAADEHTRLSQDVGADTERPECGDPNPHFGHRYMIGNITGACSGKERPAPAEPEVREQPAEPLLRGAAPLVISIDLSGTDTTALIRRMVQRPPGGRS